MEKSGRKRRTTGTNGGNCVEAKKSAQQEPAIYFGRDEYMLDPSRRVTLPSRWRTKQNEFWVLPWPIAKRDYLAVVPPSRFDRLLESMGDVSLADTDSLALQRSISGTAQKLKLDKAGRFLLPETLATLVGIKGSVLFVGMTWWFEIWDPKRCLDATPVDEAAAAKAVVGRKL